MSYDQMRPASGQGIQWRAVARHWITALLVTAYIFAGSAWYALSAPNTYDAESVVAFGPRPGSGTSGDTMRLIVSKYAVYATSRTTIQRLAPDLGENGSFLNSATHATITADTANLTIVVRLNSAKRAAAAANAIAKSVVDASKSDPLLVGAVVSPASSRSPPSGPPRGLLMGAGLLLGVLAGLVTALALERLLPRIFNSRDVLATTPAPLIAEIPAQRSRRGKARRHGKARSGNLTDPPVAAFRGLGLQLLRGAQSQPVQVVAVTSPRNRGGKSFVAAGLAATLARLDANVLLLDGDLSDPRVGAIFGAVGPPGTADVLADRVDLQSSVQSTAFSRLKVLASEPVMESNELVARRFSSLVDEARRGFDIVVVDCPPVLTGDAAHMIVTLVDAVVVVVDRGVLTRELTSTESTLTALGARVLGVVLNHRYSGSS